MGRASWYVDTIYVASPTGVGNDGLQDYGTPAAVKARVEPEHKLWYKGQGGTGAEQRTDHYIATDTEIGYDDRVWLPGESISGEGHRPIKIQVTSNKPGTSTVYEVFL